MGDFRPLTADTEPEIRDTPLTIAEQRWEGELKHSTYQHTGHDTIIFIQLTIEGWVRSSGAIGQAPVWVGTIV